MEKIDYSAPIIREDIIQENIRRLICTFGMKSLLKGLISIIDGDIKSYDHEEKFMVDLKSGLQGVLDKYNNRYAGRDDG